MRLPNWLMGFATRRTRRARAPVVAESLELRVVLASTTLSAVADAHVRGGSYANRNYGNITTLNVREDSSAASDYQSYLRFDLTSITQPIQSAILKLVPQARGSGIMSSEVRIRLLSDGHDNWIEGNGGTDNNPTNEITWNNHPIGLGSEVRVPGSQFVVGTAKSIDVTAILAQSINANKLASFQFDIPAAAKNRYVTFHSRTATTAAFRPVLVLTTGTSNRVPVATNDSASTNEDTLVNVSVIGNDTDPDGDILTVSAVTQPAHGTVVINSGSTTVRYTPTANYFGPDSFTYSTSDGRGGTATATVSLTVNAINDAPVGNDDSKTTPRDTGTIINVLANDTDVETSTLTVSSATQPAHGSIVVNANGSITYTPTTGYVGSDSFTYTVSDGSLTDTAIVSLTVAAPSVWPDRVFSPYIDFTAWPPYDFVATATNHQITYFNLGFVVADPSTNQPSWGGYYTTTSGYRLSDIQSLRNLGGDVIVSFGGAANTELAVAITDVTSLTNAYQSVIDTYSLSVIDFDIEGAWSAHAASINRRSLAMKNLQDSASAANRQLDIWLTLPVLPEGLTADGLNVVQSAIAAGVDLAGVNIMAMDYGRGSTTDMGAAAIQAATSLFNQLDTLYTNAGQPKTDAELWHLVGVTPMIGVNDTGEKFFTSDASELLAFAQQHDIGMLSMWSANRDQQGTLNVLSGSSSGVTQTPYQFQQIFDPFMEDSVPALSVSDVTVVEGNPTSSALTYFHTNGNQIVDAAGNNVKIAGVSWFGMETSTFSPHGLWTRGYRSMMDQMKSLGFNTIRLPFSNQLFDTTSTPNGIDFSMNPDLQGLTGLQIMDKIIDYAGQIGLRIILDHHRSDAGAGPNGNGLWYTNAYPETRWISDWTMLATRYANNPTIIGADLHNEPHGSATWGTGSTTTDWRAAAQRGGNAVLAANSNWLILVEGIEVYNNHYYWWGGNLEGARDYPVTLNVANRVVYSPHDYPASLYPQPWFSDSSYPNNLDAKWDTTWGYLFKENLAPVLLGEFGSKMLTTSDQQWADAIVKYVGGDFDLNGSNDLTAGQLGLSWTWWSWNPNSGDTGGILQDDWTTTHTNKVGLLQPIEFTFPSGSSTTTTSATFSVTLSAASSTPVTVNYSTLGNTATSGTDFTTTSGTLTFAPGETSKVVTIAVTRDILVESNESFFVDLSNASGATISDARGLGTITNDDGIPPPPPNSTSTIVWSTASVWDTGFTANVVITNTSSSAWTNWEIEFDHPFNITNIWNAVIVSRIGNRYRIRAESWNLSVAIGASVSFGYQADPGNPIGPTNIVLTPTL